MQTEHRSIFWLFLRFGFLAWGGPIAQIAMLRDELVDQRGWITQERFRRTLAVYQALPGPEAHELCVYFGMIRAGRLGGFLAGLAFMTPGLLLTLALAWAYTTYGAVALTPLFVGASPAVTALIVRAVYRLGTHVLVDRSHWIAAIGSAVATLCGTHFLAVLCAGAAWQALMSIGRRFLAVAASLSMIAAAFALQSMDGRSTAPKGPPEQASLLVEGLKAGMLSFGGAYASIPFLQESMVGHYQGVTQQTFLDAIALGNVIPAPLILFGAFLGYVAGGVQGALLMTFGIFLPAFSFTLLGHRYLESIIDNRALHATLDGVSAAVVGLLAVTAFDILDSVVNGWLPTALFLGAFAALMTWKSKWAVPSVILAAGLSGYLLQLAWG